MGRSCINLVGNTTQGQNLGTGTTIFAGKVGSNTLSYKSLSALGSGISITCDNNNIYFSGSTGGTSYTFNNGLTETSGTVKLGGSLCEYTNLTVGSNGITIADDDFDVYFDLNDFGYNLHHYNTNISSGGDSTYSCIQITAQPSGGTSGNLITIGSSGDVMWYNNCFIVRASSTAPNYPGIQYLTSYMADYTDRSLPDWEAVKCLVESGGTGGTSYTFNNGLIEQGDVVSLGGTLTGVTTINLDNNAFCFNLNPSTNSNVRFGDGGDTIIGEFNNPGSSYSSIFFTNSNLSFLSLNCSSNNSSCTIMNTQCNQIQYQLSGSTCSNINIHSGGISITDTNANIGMRYTADYSSNGGTNPRWIPDAAWVTGQTGGGGSGTTYTFNNGLTEGGGIVSFGGTLTGITELNLDDSEFTIFLDSSQNRCALFLNTTIQYVLNDPGSSCNVITHRSDCFELEKINCSNSFSSSISLNGDNDVSLTANKGIGCSVVIYLQQNGVNITDTVSNIGMQYASDYSTSGSTNPRWIPDNAYVTGLTTPAGNDGTLQFNDNNSFGATDMCFDDSTNTYSIGGITPSADTIMTIYDDSAYNINSCVLNVYDVNNNRTIGLEHCNLIGSLYISSICGLLGGQIGGDLSFNLGTTSGSNGCVILNDLHIRDNCITGTNPIIVGQGGLSGSVNINNILNINSRTTLPSSPSEGEIVRLSGHASCADGYHVYNGTAWQTLSTW